MTTLAQIKRSIGPGVAALNPDIAPAGKEPTFSVVFGTPIAAPRMTQQDVWRKRPCVVRYFAWRNHLRASVGPIGRMPSGMDITFHIAMPVSWSIKKMGQFDGQPHKAKPDLDNLIKSIFDGLFTEDCSIWRGSQKKLWTRPANARVEITFLYE